MKRLLLLLGFLVVLPSGAMRAQSFSLFGQTDDEPASTNYHLSALKDFNRAMLLVKEQYVEPDRLHPSEMLLSALDAVQMRVPEILISPPQNDKVTVQVGEKKKQFSIEQMDSIWDLTFKMRDISKFIETNLTKKEDLQDVEYAAINGTLVKLDPHSSFYSPKLNKELKVAIQGEFGGLGVVIGIREGYLTVISPLEGTPADKAGIKALDRVVKIEEDSTVNMGLDEAVERLRGKPGTTIHITIQRVGETKPRQISLIRDIIKVDSVSHQLLDGKLGYIKIKAFHGNTAEDMRDAIDDMQAKVPGHKLSGLILDFRNNPGGLLSQAIAIADLFLDGGVVVVTQGARADQRDEEYATDGADKTKMPIVVLVNSGSASASEIVAGALKNRNRAVIMGSQTFGKGSVQLPFDFPDGSSLKLTIAQYLTPGDISIQSVGVTPDVVLRPVFADAKDKTTLFPQQSEREASLESHLDNAKVLKSQKPTYEVTYLGQNLSADDQERLSLSSRFKDDFEINLAKRFLSQVSGSTRETLLANARALIDNVQQEESAKLIVALKKLGIDWSVSPGDSGTQLEARMLDQAVVKAGDVLKLQLEIKNVGKKPIARVAAVSQSATDLFSGREFIFGKLQPGEKRTVAVSVSIPKEAQSRRDVLRLIVRAGTNELTRLEVPVTIKGGLRPILAYTAYVDDSAAGDGDGAAQVNEKVDLVLLVKNVGPGPADEAIALVKNLSNSDVFIDKGRQALGKLMPGAQAVARLSFTVKKPIDIAKLQVQVYDASMGDFWSEKINVPVTKQPLSLIKEGQARSVAVDRTPVYANSSTTTPIALLPKGLSVRTLGAVKDMMRVEFVEGASGFVKTTTLGAAAVPAASSSKPEWVLRRVPPKIEIVSPQNPPTANGSFHFVARISDDTALQDAFLFVNDRKVYYKDFGKLHQSPVEVSTDVQLDPGVNVLTLVAREDETYGQQARFVVFSTKGDPLADIEKKEAAPL